MARRLKNWLESYLEYAKATSEGPELFHFWSGVGAIGAALRRKVYIDQINFVWTPNFYIIFVAPPGVATKSTTANIAGSLITSVPGLRLGPNALTWQMLVQTLAGACEGVPMPDGSFFNMSCMSFIASELGSFLDFRDRQMIDVLVDLWDGKEGAWEKATKTQGTDTIQSPWINFMACTTPSWLKEQMPQAMIGGGFASRCVFVYASRKRKLIAYPKYSVKPAWVDKRREDLIHDLEAIAQLKGEYILDGDAIEFGSKWYETHWTKPEVHLQGEDMAGYHSRKQTHIHKLAIVLAAARDDAGVVEMGDLQQAVKLMGIVEESMPEVFRNIHTTEEMGKVQMIVDMVNSRGRILKHDLYALVYDMMPKREFDEALTNAAFAELLTITSDGVNFVIQGKPSGTPRRSRGNGADSVDQPPEPADFAHES